MPECRAARYLAKLAVGGVTMFVARADRLAKNFGECFAPPRLDIST